MGMSSVTNPRWVLVLKDPLPLPPVTMSVHVPALFLAVWSSTPAAVSSAWLTVWT